MMYQPNNFRGQPRSPQRGSMNQRQPMGQAAQRPMAQQGGQQGGQQPQMGYYDPSVRFEPFEPGNMSDYTAGLSFENPYPQQDMSSQNQYPQINYAQTQGAMNQNPLNDAPSVLPQNPSGLNNIVPQGPSTGLPSFEPQRQGMNIPNITPQGQGMNIPNITPQRQGMNIPNITPQGQGMNLPNIPPQAQGADLQSLFNQGASGQSVEFFNVDENTIELIGKCAQNERNASVYYGYLAELAPERVKRHFEGITAHSLENHADHNDFYKKFTGKVFDVRQPEIYHPRNFKDGLNEALGVETEFLFDLLKIFRNLSQPNFQRKLTQMIFNKLAHICLLNTMTNL